MSTVLWYFIPILAYGANPIADDYFALYCVLDFKSRRLIDVLLTAIDDYKRALARYQRNQESFAKFGELHNFKRVLLDYRKKSIQITPNIIGCYLNERDEWIVYETDDTAEVKKKVQFTTQKEAYLFIADIFKCKDEAEEFLISLI